MEKIGDVWKNWCLDDMDRCLGKDGKWMERVEDKLMDLVGIGYHMFMLFWKHDECATDAQRISEIADLIEDWANANTYIHGFDESWKSGDIKHIDDKDYHTAVKDYKEKLAADAAKAAAERTQRLVDLVPDFEMPSLDMPQWAQASERYGNDQFDFMRHLF